MMALEIDFIFGDTGAKQNFGWEDVSYGIIHFSALIKTS